MKPQLTPQWTVVLSEASAAIWSRRLLAALHLPIVIAPVAYTVIYSPAVTTGASAAVVIALGVAAGVLQVRHSLAATRDEKPTRWPWTLVALVVLAYAPLPWYGLTWGFVQAMVIGSGLMLLRTRLGITLTGAVLLVSTIASVDAYRGSGDLAHLVYKVTSGLLLDFVLGVALYGAARLVYVLEQLESARLDLAELAVGRERLRVSRDLHDLLGQSLSAVSLKGDLAIRLLDENPPAARAEIQSLTEVARGALRGVRAVRRDEHTVSLSAEIDNAATLLRAAGVDATVDVNVELPAEKEAVLAWVVREGVTNVLRHSRATTCTIRAVQRDGWVRLEILNDGAGPSAPPGTGLTGLTERARAASGSLVATRTPDDHFHVVVELRIEDST